MASKNIKGITIEIGGNTTKLEDALKNVDKKVYSLNSDLKVLNQALKLDPKNTELLAQKQDVLKRNIEETRKKLDTLKEALRQMGDYSKLTDQQKESYNRLSLEIAKTENALKGMNKELDGTNKHDFTKVQNALKKVGDIAVEVTKKMLQVTAAVAGALAGLVTAGVKSYAELEKAQKGAERLFGDSFKTVEKNAQKAYKTLGLSTKDYYEQVNTYAVGLKNALNGDTKAAAELSDEILQTQADIVAATGADREAVQNAFAAVMRGNFTLIDNLRLGIKGSKEGMQEVIDKVNAWNKANGRATNYSMNSYADMQRALVDYAKMTGVAGTAQKQMSETIIGSLTQMKAAFDNFINGTGNPEALSETVVKFLNNITKAIQKVAPSILSGVVTLVKDLVPKIAKILYETIPELLDSVSKLIDEVLKLLTENSDSVEKAITELLDKAINFISNNLPKILEIALLLIVTLAKGITNSVYTLIPALVQLIKDISAIIIKNLKPILSAALQLIMALLEGIIESLPVLLDYLPVLVETLAETLEDNLPLLLKSAWLIIKTLIEGLMANLPNMMTMGLRLVVALFTGITNSMSKIKDGANGIIDTTKKTLSELPSKAYKWAGDMINGFINGIKAKLGEVGNAAKNVANKIKDFLHFSRPDEGPLREYETWMPDFVKGLADGIRKSSYLVENASLDLANDMKKSVLSDTSMALKSLNGSIQTSLNPTINPSVAYDLNYQLMAQAMKEALSDVGVYLDERKLGNFIDKTVSEEVYS